MNILTEERYLSGVAASECTGNETEQDRAGHLSGLNTYGFNYAQRETTIEQIASVGLPVTNISSLHRRQNDTGRENLLGSWGVNRHQYGEFSLYERHDHEHPEARFGTIAHELWHSVSPYVEQNAALYGGEAERRAAEAHVTAVADQSLLTDKYLNGYQKRLAEELRKGEIEEWRFREETGAIMAQLRLENPAKLHQVEKAQRAALDRLRGQRRDVPAAVQIISRPGQRPVGIDRALIALIPEVSSTAELNLHALGLKRRFYSDASFETGMDRLSRDFVDSIEEWLIKRNQRKRWVGTWATSFGMA